MRIANHECYGCGEILPATALSRVRDTEYSGTSVRKRRFKNSGTYIPSGTTTHYSVKQHLLCGGCRRKRFGRKVVGLLLGGVVFVVLGIINGNGHRPSVAQDRQGSAEAAGADARETGAPSVLQSAFSEARSLAGDERRPAGDVGDGAHGTDPAFEQIVPPKPRVRFAPRHEVVQSIPGAEDGGYPPCSVTVTDHCVGN